MSLLSFLDKGPYRDVKKTRDNFQEQIDFIISEFTGTALTRSNAHLLSSKIFELFSSFIDIDPKKIQFRLGITENNEICLLLYGDLEMIFYPFKDEYLGYSNDHSLYKEVF